MEIDIDRQGNATIKIFRKQYRKARFKRHAERLIKAYRKDGWSVLVCMCERTH